MITSSLRGTANCSAKLTFCAALAALAMSPFGCSGPQPMDVAIRPSDKATYARYLAADPSSPASAYFRWMAAESGKSVEEVRRDDASLSATHNPFDAHKDSQAVSRGAVIYASHCASCHGDNADGQGPAMPVTLKSMDFHRFSKRFAATIHRGSPRKWFRVITEGSDASTTTEDGTSVLMPAFEDQLAREQIWLTITYLQSLDIHADRDSENDI